MRILFYALVLLTVVGVIITTFETVLTILFRKGTRFFAPGPRRRSDTASASRQAVSIIRRPKVSILKPVCGLDDELERNLESFVAIPGLDYEVILSIADPADPAIAVIERVMQRHPASPFRLIIGGNSRFENGNRKVARLIAAEAACSGEVVMISDSNVRIEDPASIAETLAAFDDPRVGCVSNLFTGFGSRSVGASLESLHLLSFVVPGNVLAAFFHVPCVVGKSMAISRTALRAIGGFERFAGILAEDQAIAMALARSGFKIRLSPVVVRNIVVERTLRRALSRQVRWNQIRYAFSGLAYTSEFLANPLPFSLLAALAGFLSSAPAAFLAIPLGVALLRAAQLAAQARVMDARLSPGELMLVPLLDLLQFGAQFVPYFDDRVTWRGFSARIGPETRLITHQKRKLAA